VWIAEILFPIDGSNFSSIFIYFPETFQEICKFRLTISENVLKELAEITVNEDEMSRRKRRKTRKKRKLRKKKEKRK